MEYVRSVNGYSAGFPRPFEHLGSTLMEGPRRGSPEHPPLRGPVNSLYPELYSGRPSFDQRVPDPISDINQSYRRQSLQFVSERRGSLTTEVDNRVRRCSLPNLIPKGFKPEKKRVVGNGVYKRETFPWHESSLRQAMARRTHERKEQLASPLPLINLRPEAETRLRDLLGEEGYAEWRQKHRASYLLNQS